MIVAAAYLASSTLILTANRHSEFVPILQRLGHSRIILAHQGFITHEGNFLHRDDARDHAKNCGQIPQDFNRVLTSEDLW